MMKNSARMLATPMITIHTAMLLPSPPYLAVSVVSAKPKIQVRTIAKLEMKALVSSSSSSYLQDYNREE